MNLFDSTFDPALDLKLERVVPVSPDLVWKAWTDPEHMVHWFVPKPWKCVSVELDLRPGGTFHSVMQSPEGETFENPGCYLLIEEGKQLVFTDALLPGFRPSSEPFMTASVSVDAHPDGTKYTAIAKHTSEAKRQEHEEMGFHDGWSTVLDQLVEYIQSL
ncbi:MAG: SRPBCC family protein [Rubricoccaceae bacterium]|nr:SRPBCC family protein [Rubricoccaceae bacterium]